LKRAARAKLLKEEAETAEQLAKLTEAERAAVARVVRGEIAVEGRRSTRLGIWMSLLFFVLGVGASVGVTLLVHPLS
jgi:type VI protein secretion system component VasF